MNKPNEIRWLALPEEHDYPSAASFLSLVYDERTAARLVEQLRQAALARFKAKDIFRAAGVSLLGLSNYHVEKDRSKIRQGKALSPLLLVRDKSNAKLLIADGYHRLCAVYGYDEDAVVPCKIV